MNKKEKRKIKELESKLRMVNNNLKHAEKMIEPLFVLNIQIPKEDYFNDYKDEKDLIKKINKLYQEKNILEDELFFFKAKDALKTKKKSGHIFSTNYLEHYDLFLKHATQATNGENNE